MSDEWLLKAIEARRGDPGFMKRLQERVEQDKPILDRLATPAYAVHVLMGVENGVTDEMTQESPSLDHALALIKQAATQVPSFQAITLVHGEDFANLMQGASAS